MADEAVIIDLLGNQGDPVEFTVSATTAIPKGTLMKISDSSTAIIGTAASLFAGITDKEKTATDGITKMALITHAIVDLTCGAGESMTLANPVMIGAASNEVTVATGDTIDDAPKVVGLALETVAGNGTGAVLMNVGKRR